MISGNGHKVIQGLASLAAGDGFGCVVLQTEQEIPERRSIRSYQPVTAVICVGSGEHRRRSWARKLPNFHPVFANLSRIAQGNRDTYYSGRTTRAGHQTRTQGCTIVMRRNRKNAALAHSRDSGQKMNPLFAIRYSLFASLVLFQ
jgi:hypothetical protein